MNNDFHNTGTTEALRRRKAAIKRLEELFSWAELYSKNPSEDSREKYEAIQLEIENHKNENGLD